MAIGKARATPDPLLKVMSDNQSVEVLSSEAHFDDILNVPVVEGAIDGRDAMMTSNAHSQDTRCRPSQHQNQTD